MGESKVKEVDVKEQDSVLDEGEISREDVFLRREREGREYLEGLKKFIESDKDTLTPMTSVAMRKASMKKRHSKYWDVYWTLQEIVKSDDWTTGLAKERAEKFDGLEDRLENLQSRCIEIKEFYNADGFDFFYQTPEKEPAQEEVAAEGLEQDSIEQSEDELLRRHTFSARGNEPSADAEVPRSQSCSSIPVAMKTESPGAKLQVKSSLVVLEEHLETGLVVIGSSVTLQRKKAESDYEAREPVAVPKLPLNDLDEGELNGCPPPPPPSFRNCES